MNRRLSRFHVQPNLLPKKGKSSNESVNLANCSQLGWENVVGRHRQSPTRVTEGGRGRGRQRKIHFSTVSSYTSLFHSLRLPIQSSNASFFSKSSLTYYIYYVKKFIDTDRPTTQSGNLYFHVFFILSSVLSL